jgi:RNA polymerase-binding transcription factor DksA
MTTKRRGRRAWLAVVTAGLAGLGTLMAGWGNGSASPTAGADPADRRPATAQPAPPSRYALPPAVVVRGSSESNLAAAARRHAHRGRGPDATGGQFQLPASGTGSAFADSVADAADHRAPGVFSPAWRSVLEARWQQRLAAVTALSLAYHDAAERLQGDPRSSGHAGVRQFRQVMQQAVAARRALASTEEALARLSAGRFGRCEQCAAAIPAAQLALDPETLYCVRCTQPQAAPDSPGPAMAAAS